MQAAPLFDAIANGPAGGVAHWLKTSDGLRIRVGHWQGPSDSKGTVLIFPGRTEYVEKYGMTAQALRDRGYDALAIDWRGQGLADRMTDNRGVGHVGEFADYQKDVAAVMAYVAERDLPKPYYLLAHSMGGCIGLRAVLEGLDVKASAFSAPMWGIQMAPAMRPVAWGLSSISKSLGFDKSLAPGQSVQPYVMRAEFKGNTLTTDPEMFGFMRKQITTEPDLALGGPSLRWLNTSLREMHDLSMVPSPSVPCIAFLGTEEAIIDPARVQARIAKWPGASLRAISGGQHEMMMDNPARRKTVFDDAATLFNAHY